ncbi:hypothetical protein BABINDRAFT_168050 [Babjeviella inositovora NRRL Y-12698]|uniref:Uncharacterized protein n=1 Tax=Babjeviella inositovora NRRL Y-12698 TaxID=984486 RepID=A0A1E3QMF9_9ASCO|nr:uncharacterized protein BABINDRAFT_168050 [Babjeviella inositovora NRRL Y-12698]ODQ78873.1 hypothetical protein BABINDRAFT_168050 [Babjeviella inositovora NRRL Y-12698]
MNRRSVLGYHTSHDFDKSDLSFSSSTGEAPNGRFSVPNFTSHNLQSLGTNNLPTFDPHNYKSKAVSRAVSSLLRSHDLLSFEAELHNILQENLSLSLLQRQACQEMLRATFDLFQVLVATTGADKTLIDAANPAFFDRMQTVVNALADLVSQVSLRERTEGAPELHISPRRLATGPGWGQPGTYPDASPVSTRISPNMTPSKPTKFDIHHASPDVAVYKKLDTSLTESVLPRPLSVSNHRQLEMDYTPTKLNHLLVVQSDDDSEFSDEEALNVLDSTKYGGETENEFIGYFEKLHLSNSSPGGFPGFSTESYISRPSSVTTSINFPRERPVHQPQSQMFTPVQQDSRKFTHHDSLPRARLSLTTIYENLHAMLEPPRRHRLVMQRPVSYMTPKSPPRQVRAHPRLNQRPQSMVFPQALQSRARRQLLANPSPGQALYDGYYGSQYGEGYQYERGYQGKSYLQRYDEHHERDPEQQSTHPRF